MDDQGSRSFRSWVARPEVLVALAAVLLSLCGLFVAIYETTLIRQEQRASAWPSLMVGYTWALTDEGLRIWVVNRGVGPARVRAAALEYRGEHKENWREVLRGIYDDDTSRTIEQVGEYGYVNGFVYPGSMTEAATIFRVPVGETGVGEDVAQILHREIVMDGHVDVVVCYCSVYDECWITRLQGTLAPVAGRSTPQETAQEVRSCDGTPVSNL